MHHAIHFTALCSANPEPFGWGEEFEDGAAAKGERERDEKTERSERVLKNSRLVFGKIEEAI